MAYELCAATKCCFTSDGYREKHPCPIEGYPNFDLDGRTVVSMVELKTRRADEADRVQNLFQAKTLG